MRFPDYGIKVPTAQQEQFNSKALHAAQNPAESQISRSDVFNSYTGKGGLSRLTQSDYSSYHAYAQDKRSREAGQFFTPGWLAEVLTVAVQLEDDETVCDPAAGHGALFNACIGEDGRGAARLFGCELDGKAVTVAEHLFPEATIERNSFSFYHPGVAVDCLLANPPFALKVQVGKQRYRSEEALLLKSAEFVRPGGLCAAVVPASLYADAFSEKSRFARLDRLWRPLGRIYLDDQAFARAGVSGLETSVLLLQRRGHALQEALPEYAPGEEPGLEEAPTITLSTPKSDREEAQVLKQVRAFAEKAVAPARALASEYRAELELERRRGRLATEEAAKDRRTFSDRVSKLLYDISQSEARAHYPRAKALYERFLSQNESSQRPSHLSASEWEKSRLKPGDVLSKLEAILSKQHGAKKRADLSARGLLPPTEELEHAPERAVRVVKRSGSVALKAYTQEAQARLERREAQGLDNEWSISEMTIHDRELPRKVQQSDYSSVIERKRQLRRDHEGDVMDVEPPAALVEWCFGLTIQHPDREAVAAGKRPESFTLDGIQALDLARFLARRYTLVSWDCGTGKTAVSYCYMQVALGNWSVPEHAIAPEDLCGGVAPVKAGFVVSTAFAIEETWKPFLDAQGASYRVISSRADVVAAQEEVESYGAGALSGEILVVSLSKVYDLRHPLRQLGRLLSYRTCVVLDESDEITNPQSLQTKGVLAAFRRSEATLPMTGTPTRNNIGEIYSQLELLYNNSALLPSTAPLYYPRNADGEPEAKPNPLRGQAIPAYHGEQHFARCFNPREETVFGILSQNQCIYNAEALNELLERTRIVRTFSEVAGEGRYQLKHEGVRLAPQEATLHERIMKEFSLIWKAYFESTGSSRKDAGLRAVRQLFTLIDSARFPHLFEHYQGQRSDYCRKMKRVKSMIRARRSERVAIGLRRREVFEEDYLAHWAGFLAETGRETFIVEGSKSQRGAICKAFQRSENGVLIATQQSLPSSINIPRCNTVLLPELPWNFSAASQFWSRFVRRDMAEPTTIHLITYRESIEGNILRLLCNKERLNRFVRSGQLPSMEDLLDAMQIEASALEAVLEKVEDVDGNVTIDWRQRVMS